MVNSEQARELDAIGTRGGTGAEVRRHGVRRHAQARVAEQARGGATWGAVRCEETRVAEEAREASAAKGWVCSRVVAECRTCPTSIGQVQRPGVSKLLEIIRGLV